MGLFKRKEKSNKMAGSIHFIDLEGTVFKKIPVTHIEFKRDLIILKSIDKFNDNDPCIIHETYCRNMLAFELMEMIDKRAPEIIGEELKIDDIPEFIKEQIEWNLSDNTSYIKFV